MGQNVTVWEEGCHETGGKNVTEWTFCHNTGKKRVVFLSQLHYTFIPGLYGRKIPGSSSGLSES
jgi:hypothetical protein